MDGSHGTADLQPGVKLLYLDYSNASEADLRYAVCLLVMMFTVYLLTYFIILKPL
jgi:hypothetical protein